MEKVRRDTIRKLGDMAAMEYPLDIDIKHQTKQGIMDKLKFTSPISNLSIQYELNPSSLCNGVDPYILILIKSAVKHHYLRYILRNTWIKEIYRTFPIAKVAFLLGYSHKERLIVWSENQVSGDIIQGNFTDAYRNNTFKTFMAFQWVERFCSKAKFIFFVDDDMFVNVKLMEKYLRTKSITNETDLLSGMIVKGGLPAREDLSPWYIGKEDYPFLLYPPYLAGCAMILSQSAVRKIAAVFPYVKYFPFDDVLLGIIMNKLGMDIEQNEYLYNVHVNNVTVLHKMMANHGFRDDEFLSKIYNGYSEKFLLKDKRLFL
ncbi:hypothetical protein FSP39_003664 [Pinctada imbricata]|uniref:Hexosyltransferase n=1 Tax=Pinctada imbricata TaxID=66713 RepID=A0AA88YH70_PINIB|nr:hypothetical protein FSP39_003664 [Pinctada imbricata]